MRAPGDTHLLLLAVESYVLVGESEDGIASNTPTAISNLHTTTSRYLFIVTSLRSYSRRPRSSIAGLVTSWSTSPR